jgi:hypothetical protein
MNRSKVRVHRVTGLAAVAGAFIAMAAAPAGAQTSTAPNNQSKWSTPQPTKSAKAPRRPNSCSQYGDGYVYVASTDTCVRVGGYVRLDISR